MNALRLSSLLDLEGLLPAHPAMRNRLVLLGAIFLVMTAVATRLLLRRALNRRRSQRCSRSRRRNSFRRTVVGMAELKKMASHKLRHRRREHRPRNPTLAETGGLPPVRSDELLESPQPQPQ
jgi:hypothetical protein